MAVDAQHPTLFPQQFLANRDLMFVNGTTVECNNENVFGLPMGYVPMTTRPVSGTTTTAATETAVPMYGSGVFPAKIPAIKADSGLTYASVSRKRPRDAISNNPLLSQFQNGAVQNCNAMNSRCSFLGEDISFQIQQQQFEIDRFIAQHTEKVRTEIEERRKRYCRRIAATVEENVMKKLKAKEEEIEKIGKLNWALEERVKSLCVENQIWRDLAQTNEANANALRSDLEQVLSQLHDNEQQQQQQRDDVADDANSCCDSNFNGYDDHRGDNASTKVRDRLGDGCIAPRMCRSCGREESCVLLLPCRHLCLCAVCGSALHTCPVCNAVKTASVHVDFSV